MASSAFILGTTGILLTFIPDEILSHLSIETNKPAFFLIQILGALYFAFVMLNLMTKTRLIGGIYNGPTHQTKRNRMNKKRDAKKICKT